MFAELERFDLQQLELERFMALVGRFDPGGPQTLRIQRAMKKLAAERDHLRARLEVFLVAP